MLGTKKHDAADTIPAPIYAEDAASSTSMNMGCSLFMLPAFDGMASSLPFDEQDKSCYRRLSRRQETPSRRARWLPLMAIGLPQHEVSGRALQVMQQQCAGEKYRFYGRDDSSRREEENDFSTRARKKKSCYENRRDEEHARNFRHTSNILLYFAHAHTMLAPAQAGLRCSAATSARRADS